MDLARRFLGLPADAPRVARTAPLNLSVGDSQEFILIDLEAPSQYRISASVRLITDHAYFFVEDGLEFSSGALETAAANFEASVYPRVTAAFGKEWSPGVDGDPRITILHANLRGAGGYVTASDEFPVAAVPYGNEREMLYLHASALSSSAAYYDALAAHEFQHLVHQNADPDEDAWVNEGLSQVAAETFGGGVANVQPFLLTPDTQLNDWPAEGDTAVHYAASQLFVSYLLDRFGGREQAFRLVQVPEDSVVGVAAYLQPFGVTFLDVFADWLAANYLDEESGPYSHAGTDATVATVTSIRQAGDGEGSVHQLAADYLEVEPPAVGAVFHFDGADEVSVGVPARDGPFWWSNRGDSIDSRLTREFDLSRLTSATLRYWAWFDVERGFDYAYVAASSDGGRTWRALPGRHTSDHNPVGAAYGPGYTGVSGGGTTAAWVPEEVDLTPFTGGKVLVRFEYVTDDSANQPGLAVDDVEIPELGFRDTANSDGGWSAEGFRRVQGPLSQRFLLQVIERGPPSRVTRVPIATGNQAEVQLTGPTTIVVAGVTEGTTDVASYRWTLAAP